jgi:hypothetical protein
MSDANERPDFSDDPAGSRPTGSSSLRELYEYFAPVREEVLDGEFPKKNFSPTSMRQSLRCELRNEPARIRLSSKIHCLDRSSMGEAPGTDARDCFRYN